MLLTGRSQLVVFALVTLLLLTSGPASGAPGEGKATGPATEAARPSLIGGEAWLGNSTLLNLFAANSTILALPSFSTWLSSHSISVYDLKPYLSLYPSSGNPYDYSQGAVGFKGNDTVYNVYTYILPNETVIGVWVMQGNPTIVGRPYTFPSQSGDDSFSSLP